MPTQSHHLIPLNVVRDHPLFKALRAGSHNFVGATLDLPDKASAAAAAASSLAGDVADVAHEGRHYKAYDKLVQAYLDRFADNYVEHLGGDSYRLIDGVNPTDIFDDLKSLEVRLATYWFQAPSTDCTT